MSLPLPLYVVILSSLLSLAYKSSRSLQLERASQRHLTTIHAFTLESIQLLLLSKGLVSSFSTFFHTEHSTTLPRTLSAVLPLAIHSLAIFLIDTIDTRVQTGDWVHPVQIQVFLLTRYAVMPCLVWRRDSPGERRERKERERMEGEGSRGRTRARKWGKEGVEGWMPIALIHQGTFEEGRRKGEVDEEEPSTHIPTLGKRPREGSLDRILAALQRGVDASSPQVVVGGGFVSGMKASADDDVFSPETTHEQETLPIERQEAHSKHENVARKLLGENLLSNKPLLRVNTSILTGQHKQDKAQLMETKGIVDPGDWTRSSSRNTTLDTSDVHQVIGLGAPSPSGDTDRSPQQNDLPPSVPAKQLHGAEARPTKAPLAIETTPSNCSPPDMVQPLQKPDNLPLSPPATASKPHISLPTNLEPIFAPLPFSLPHQSPASSSNIDIKFLTTKAVPRFGSGTISSEGKKRIQTPSVQKKSPVPFRTRKGKNWRIVGSLAGLEKRGSLTGQVGGMVEDAVERIERGF